jgi:hypothetical protein
MAALEAEKYLSDLEDVPAEHDPATNGTNGTNGNL